MNVRKWLAVSVYMVIVQAFVALTDGVGPHTGERRFKCGHNFNHTPYSARKRGRKSPLKVATTALDR